MLVFRAVGDFWTPKKKKGFIRRFLSTFIYKKTTFTVFTADDSYMHRYKKWVLIGQCFSKTHLDDPACPAVKCVRRQNLKTVYTLEINGWNTIMEVDERRFSFSNGWVLGSMYSVFSASNVWVNKSLFDMLKCHAMHFVDLCYLNLFFATWIRTTHPFTRVVGGWGA